MKPERARSLSPTKDTSSNAGTPGSVRSRNDMSMHEDLSRTPSLQPPASRRSSGLDIAPSKTSGAPPKTDTSESDAPPRGLPQPPSTPQALVSTSPNAAMAPSRSNTLSWQQRPTSRGLTGPRSRPLSMVVSENGASRSPRQSAEPEHAPPKDDNMSRSQIAQSLGAKDPTWFRQNQERGQGSAAYRRNQDDPSDIAPMTGSMRLLGMSRESTAEPESRMSPPPESVRSNSPSVGGSIRGTSGFGSSSASMSSASGVRSPLPTMSSQRFEPTSSDTTSASGGDTPSIGRSLAMSPAQGRISPERMDRPSSPTKGLGGFVQSAMMKRSDSVNKRWSAQAGPGLSRGNSVASNTSGYTSSRYPIGGITPLSESRPSSISRDNSPALKSRPGSSHSNTTVTQGLDENDRPGTSASATSNKTETRFEDKFPKSALQDVKSPPIDESMNPPASPSKRWSPSKASWLENAINKPDSPRLKSPAPQQPSWKADINRAKQQRGSVDLGTVSNYKEVSIGGLVRSPPPGAGYKVPTIGGLPSGFSAGVAAKPRAGSSDDVGRRSGSPESTKAKDVPRTMSPLSAQFNEPSKSEVEPVGAIAIVQKDEKPVPSPPANKNAPQKDLSPNSPIASKPKLETPPKKDFRTNLKSRPDSGEAKSKDEPEFKNVFGKLKRTQTQNYKAPDELKDNIMRGKSGLTQTGGPKKTQRKDEFKESILQKKQGMVALSASTRITSASSKNLDQSAPEAIAKRGGLTRSDSLASSGSAEGPKEKELSKPEALAKLQHLRDKPKHVPPERQSSPPLQAQKEAPANGGLRGSFASSLAGILQRGPSPMAAKPGSVPTSEHAHEKTAVSQASDEAVASAGPQLTHATIARARGPKRRLPTTNTKVEAASESVAMEKPQSERSIKDKTPTLIFNTSKPQSLSLSPSKSNPRPLSNITHNNNNNRKVSQPKSPRKPSTSIAQSQDMNSTSPISKSSIKESEAKTSPVVKQKPVTSPKDDKIRTVPLSSTLKSQPETPSEPKNTQEPRQNESSSTPAQRQQDPEPPGIHGPLPSVKGAAALWGQSPKPTQLGGPRSPVKLPTRKDEEDAQEEAGLRTREPADLGINDSVNGPSTTSGRPPPLSAAQSPKSPPLPGKKSASIVSRVIPATPTAAAQSNKSMSSQHSQAANLFADIFDTVPSSKQSINFDTQAVINACSSIDSSQKIKTLRKQIFEIKDNGRSVPIPAQQEHILFEDSLYLCTHVFGTLTGQRTSEAYLWCGDGVSSSAVNDAHVFAKKAAKDNNGKLVVLKQGKETANFFQALGGIVITRRGSNSRSDSSAPYVLCGRQHVGQIAFDEVDFHPQSLCKGFPYIISAGGGKLYLWKGSGSGADELGCARLIGMDLGLTGEIEEVDEGKESSAFWQCFGGGRGDIATSSGQHWHLKPSCEKYTNRLFGIDVEIPRPKSSSGFMQWGRRGSAPSTDTNIVSTAQIKEVLPFAQSDLVDDGVFVLDTFFEIFV